jgi:hypothetical protein
MLNISCSKNIRGRCVVADKSFIHGEIIETAPILLVEKKHNKHLVNYTYEWHGKKIYALVLGYGSVYNHSYKPNANFYWDYSNQQMIYMAIKNIEIGEEITVNYNGVANDKTPLWFNVK